MKKTIYTLNINHYSSEITDLTYPLIKFWAYKIGAEFHIIDERKFLEYPVVYEKLQMYDLALKKQDDWNIFIDSDVLVHPENLDWTIFLSKDTVAQYDADMANIRWRYDEYFLRDGRHIGTCNWLTFVSNWCLDFYKPLEDMELKEALNNMFPTPLEYNSVGMTPEHMIDDYVLSRNLARYGIKYKSIKRDIMPAMGYSDAEFFWHMYLVPTHIKIQKIKETLNRWNIPSYIRNYKK